MAIADEKGKGGKRKRGVAEARSRGEKGKREKGKRGVARVPKGRGAGARKGQEAAEPSDRRDGRNGTYGTYGTYGSDGTRGTAGDGIDYEELFRVVGTRRGRKAMEARAERWKVYEGIPIGDWVAMSGRAHKVLYEQAARYGIPFGQETIRLPVVVRALHDFLAFHGRKILATEPDPMLAGVGGDETPGLERYRMAKAKRAEFELEKMQGSIVDCAELRQVWGIVASHLRSASWVLQRGFGEKARRVIEDALGKAEEMIVARFGKREETAENAKNTEKGMKRGDAEARRR